MLGLYSSMVIIDEVHRMNDDDNHVPGPDMPRLRDLVQRDDMFATYDPAAVNRAPTPEAYARGRFARTAAAGFRGVQEFTHRIERAGQVMQWVAPDPDALVWNPGQTVTPEGAPYRTGTWTAPSAGTWRITVDRASNEVIGAQRTDVPDIPGPPGIVPIPQDMLGGYPVRVDANVPEGRIHFAPLDPNPIAFQADGEPDPFEDPLDVKINVPLASCACGDPMNKSWEHTQDACDFLD